MRRVGHIALDPAAVHASARERSLSIEVELFPGERHVFDFNRSETALSGSVSWNGTLRSDTDEGYLTLTASPRSVSGIVQTGLRRYVLRSVSATQALVGEVDPRREAKCLMPETRPEIARTPTGKGEQAWPAEPRAKSSNEEIDLVVFYTPEVADNYLFYDPTVDIDALVADMNTSFSDSGIGAEVRAIHYQEVDVDNPTFPTEFSELWDEIRGDQGNLADTSAIRSNSGGDLVVLLVAPIDPELCGIAGSQNIPNPLGPSDLSYPAITAANKAFAVVSITCAAGDLTFAHELGHELGGWHGAPITNNCGIDDQSCGHARLSSPYFRTIMSSNQTSGFECLLSGCPRINRWSNYGKNIVISSTSYPLGRTFDPYDTNDANELTLDGTTAAFVAGYRSAGGSAPGNVSGLSVSTCHSAHNASWSAASGYPGWYEAQRADNSGFSGSLAIYGGPVRDITFEHGTNFYLRVRACNAVGCSAWSATGLNDVSQCL
jgi:peptidyl-Asp metalloendopeptidase